MTIFAVGEYPDKKMPDGTPVRFYVCGFNTLDDVRDFERKSGGVVKSLERFEVVDGEVSKTPFTDWGSLT